MNKQQIIDYVMNSPANTNPSVLGSIIETLINENSGYKVKRGNLVKTNGIVANIANLIKIGPLVICEFNGYAYESNMQLDFVSSETSKEEFKPNQANPKAVNYNNSHLYIDFGDSNLIVGFLFGKTGDYYYLSIKGNSSSYVGQSMKGIAIYFTETDESII